MSFYEVMGRPSVSSYHRGVISDRYGYHIPPENGGSRGWHGPRKVISFCLLAVFLPCILVSLCLLMRFVAHGSSLYHLAPTDMRILDHRISTIWCQSETVKGNTTFTAYLTNGEPEMVKSPEPVVVEKNLIIPDDHKEYWGFYLLEGSTFRVHTCARFKGGTLLIVQGRNHLEHCAYIGESDSAGNSDEFSSSNSRESPSSDTSNSTQPGGPGSREEMGAILSKIRQYIRSRPKNYSKLKKNLADWMLIDNSTATTTSLEEEEELENSTTKSELPEEENSPNSQNLTETPVSTSLPLVEHGKLLRRRRGAVAELRKISESGEDGAFEEIDPILEKDKQNKTQNHNHHAHHTAGGSIWSQEHLDEHGILNDHFDPNDGSNSESESSWSSSEEAMAKCEGVLGNFQLKGNETCGLDSGNWTSNLEPFYEGHVNTSGYYYFIFGSENEKRDNIIKIRFEMEKYVYHLPPPIANCTGVRECKVNFTFASNEKLVITVPQPTVNFQSAWDHVYVAESDCLPRTSLYLVFVILVPLVILLCAFQ